jgi:hypothetical protein
MTYFIVPSYREFANECGFCYQTEDEKIARSAAEFLDGVVVDEDYVVDLQKQMHLAAGCSHPTCTCADDFQEYDEEGEYVPNCEYEIQSAADFADELPVELRK